MFNEIQKQLEQAQNDGQTFHKIPVNEKSNTLQLFAFLKKSGYNPSFESSKDGEAYIEVKLKPVSFSSKIIDLKTKIENRVVSVKKNVIEVNFKNNNTDESGVNITEDENNVIPLKMKG